MLNNTALINSIKLNGSVPENTSQWSDTNILLFATETMNEILLPGILAIKKEYFVRSYERAIVANKANYRLPSRASFGILRDIYLSVSGQIKRIQQIDRSEIYTTTPGVTTGFYMESNSVILYPPPSDSSWMLGMPYYIRPSTLIPVAQAAQVLSFDPITRTITFAGTLPVGFTVGAQLDMVHYKPNYQIMQVDNVITAADTNLFRITLQNDLDLDISVGDWFTPAGYSPVPNIPEEFHSILAMTTASRILGALGQLDQQKGVDAQIQLHMKAMNFGMLPRVRGQEMKMTTNLI